MNLRSRKRGEGISMDLTPLIDIVFLLLIFFLVTTTFTKKKTEDPNAIPVNLPGGASGTDTSDEDSVILTVTSDGLVQIDNSMTLTDGELISKMQDLHKTQPNTVVMLRGDAGSSHGRIIEVLDKIKLSGFQKVNLVVKKQSVSGGVSGATGESLEEARQ